MSRGHSYNQVQEHSSSDVISARHILGIFLGLPNSPIIANHRTHAQRY